MLQFFKKFSRFFTGFCEFFRGLEAAGYSARIINFFTFLCNNVSSVPRLFSDSFGSLIPVLTCRIVQKVLLLNKIQFPCISSRPDMQQMIRKGIDI